MLDPQGSVVPDAKVTVKNVATGIERTTQTDSSGNFLVASLPVGTYRIEIQREGFQTFVVSELKLEVDTIVSRNYTLKVGELTQTTLVTTEAPVIEASTITVGQVINSKTVQEIPLNGRHFIDLTLLIPGTVTPPQSGFLTAPLRGQGSFGVVTAGNREDAVNYMINGVNLNDMLQNQITFQPSINTVQEFKVDNSTYSAEYGRNSGAIINIATRSGTNAFHGEAFEFLRNDAVDARNFFNPKVSSSGTAIPINPFKRNQFGASGGGPIWKDHTFFFLSYEGLRQRQRIDISQRVLSDAERAQAVTPTATFTPNPTVVKLLGLIPKANSADSLGRPLFVGGATAPVNIDQGTADVSHNFRTKDRLHGYYALQQDLRQEPTLAGNNIPGFGDTRQARRQIFTLNETHIFGPALANEARLGFNRIHITFTPNALLNPADFGINDGITTPIGLPQISITSINLNFGGPSGFPQGRGDLTGVFSDTLSWLRGKHAFKFGGEVRRFYNNNFSLDNGAFRSPDVPSFINGRGDRFAITLGSGASRIVESAWGLLAMDSYKLRTNLTLELGFRYDQNLAPSEAQNRFVVLDPNTRSLVRVSQPYDDNKKNFQPRLGFAWDPFGNGKTSLRGAYAIQVDQPVTNGVTPLTVNPPLAQPLLFTPPASDPNARTTFATARADAVGAGLAPASINGGFDNANVQSWNLSVQREITPTLGLMVGYFGSKGTHLRISRNINQFINSSPRPFPAVSASSSILPNTALSNITLVDSVSNSSYNALWITGNKRLSHGLQFNASYTYGRSIDENSRNSNEGVIAQDSFNIRANRGLSEFDVRHRFVINWLYELPFRGNRWVEGWQLSGIIQYQSGNPIAIAFPDPFTGSITMQPDLVGSIQLFRDPRQWFANNICDPSRLNPLKLSVAPPPCTSRSVFALPVANVGGKPVWHFGNLGRNVVTGPRFSNFDFSVLKRTRITELVRIEFRTDFFNIFNHPNFGQPNRTVTASDFGIIRTTRFPTGDSGTSRQVQFALKFIF